MSGHESSNSQDLFFLKDSRIDDWLVSGFKKRGCSVSFIGRNDRANVISMSRLIRIKTLHQQYLKIAWKGIMKSERKDIIICYYVKNMSISDIADALDISYRTVVNIKTRAIEKLKKILKQQ